MLTRVALGAYIIDTLNMILTKYSVLKRQYGVSGYIPPRASVQLWFIDNINRSLVIECETSICRFLNATSGDQYLTYITSPDEYLADQGLSRYTHLSPVEGCYYHCHLNPFMVKGYHPETRPISARMPKHGLHVISAEQVVSLLTMELHDEEWNHNPYWHVHPHSSAHPKVRITHALLLAKILSSRQGSTEENKLYYLTCNALESRHAAFDLSSYYATSSPLYNFPYFHYFDQQPSQLWVTDTWRQWFGFMASSKPWLANVYQQMLIEGKYEHSSEGYNLVPLLQHHFVMLTVHADQYRAKAIVEMLTDPETINLPHDLVLLIVAFVPPTLCVWIEEHPPQSEYWLQNSRYPNTADEIDKLRPYFMPYSPAECPVNVYQRDFITSDMPEAAQSIAIVEQQVADARHDYSFTDCRPIRGEAESLATSVIELTEI